MKYVAVRPPDMHIGGHIIILVYMTYTNNF